MTSRYRSAVFRINPCWPACVPACRRPGRREFPSCLMLLETEGRPGKPPYLPLLPLFCAAESLFTSRKGDVCHFHNRLSCCVFCRERRSWTHIWHDLPWALACQDLTWFCWVTPGAVVLLWVQALASDSVSLPVQRPVHFPFLMSSLWHPPPSQIHPTHAAGSLNSCCPEILWIPVRLGNGGGLKIDPLQGSHTPGGTGMC